MSSDYIVVYAGAGGMVGNVVIALDHPATVDDVQLIRNLAKQGSGYSNIAVTNLIPLAPARTAGPPLALYRVTFPDSDYDQLHSAVVYATSPEQAEGMARGESTGNPLGAGTVVEIELDQPGVIHTHVVHG